MKTLILKSKFFLVTLTLLAFMSCSKDDDSSEPQAQAPSVTYAATTLDAIFFQAGNSAAPNLNWNGNQGSFSLASSIAGLSINSTSGVLNWTNALPIGTHNVQVIATNSAGQTTINITINNPLQGTFTGTYDGSNFYEIDFFTNGTADIRANSATSPDTATGTWTMTNNTIVINYTYDGTTFEYSTSGTLTVGNDATYAGDWYSGYNAVPGNEGGTFTTTLN